jgi:DNA polymerase elongation subunit (family B)
LRTRESQHKLITRLINQATKMSIVDFQILDIISRDQVILSEEDGVREITYENTYESDDDEFISAARKKKVKIQSTLKKELVIHLFGRTKEGRKVRVDIDGFRPSFALRIPAQYNLGEALMSIKRYVNDKAPAVADEIRWTTEKKKTFYGFTADTYFNYVVISVPSLDMFRRVRNLFLNNKNYPALLNNARLGKPWIGNEVPEISDAMLDPMLRFLHLRYIDPCGWVRADAYSYDSDSETYLCQWEHIGPFKSDVAIAPFKKLFWDIECTSDSGDFPLAKKNFSKLAKEVLVKAVDARHAVDLIMSGLPYKEVEPVNGITRLALKRPPPARNLVESALLRNDILDGLDAAIQDFKKANADEKSKIIDTITGYLKMAMPSVAIKGDPIIQVGCVLVEGEKISRHLFAQPDCAEIDGVIVHSSATEADMLKAWCKWMREADPDVLVGYNIFGFDEKYIHERMEELGIVHNDDYETFNRLCIDGGEMKLEEKFLSSSALGDNYMYMWNVQGRLQVDLYHYVRRTNTSLTSYKLDAVTQYYLSGKIGGVDITDNASWLLTMKGATKEIKVGRAVVLLDPEGEQICEKLEVMEVLGAGVFRVHAPEDIEAVDVEEVKRAPKWAMGKDDVSPRDIFRLQKGTAKDRAIVGKYCIQDCDLTYDLYRKLETFPNAMAMANVCSVPIGYIFTRGQGIKIESLIFREAWRRDQRIPVQPAPNREGVQDSYEGAIVLTPEPGIYANVGVCDFASLYPSTIESENISHDSLVWVKDYHSDGTLIGFAWGSEDYDELEGWQYTDITFDILKPDPMDTRKNPKKIKMGLRVCRYAQYPMPTEGAGALVDRKSTLPQIVQMLLAARKQKRKEAATETDPARINLLDVEQLAYKLTANSLYGQLGSSTFKVRLQHLAASVTSYGRTQIMFAKAAIERFYGNGRDDRCDARCETKVVYGDSVVGDTPVFLKKDDNVYMKRIDEMCVNEKWTTYHETKECIDLLKENISVWTEKGFTKINRLIRHRLAPTKKLFRILTHTGIVDATEDHSLVMANGEECKPTDVNLNTELLHNHNQHTSLREIDCGISEDEAWVMGLFMADGSCDTYIYEKSVKSSWAINKADIKLLEKAKEKCGFNSVILNTLESSGVYKLVPHNESTKTIVTKYRELFYNEHREKRVPECILNSPLKIVKSFWDGFYSGDGDKDENGYCRFDQKGKEVCHGLYLLARKLGYNVSINNRIDKPTVFRLTMTKKIQRKNPNKIKKIIELPHPGEAYVYDFETENHHFAVGPGALVVHNTDSLFVQFNPKNPETGEDIPAGREARQAVFDLTEEAGHFVTKGLKPPHDFEFDKAFDPIMIFSKKRYTGHMYEVNPDEYVQKSMGIVMKRRDNAPILKLIYGGALRKMICDNDIVSATEFVKQSLHDLIEGKVPWSQLTITKSLRAEYANPLSIAHKVLANRIAARDPGNAPVAGDRIPFMYVRPTDGQQASKLQGDRIELPAYAREKDLQPDYEMYLENQLAIPISQLFSLVVERMPGYDPEILEKRKCKLKGNETKEELSEYIMSIKESIAYDMLFSDIVKRYRQKVSSVVMRSIFGCVPVYAKDMGKKYENIAAKVASTGGRTLIPDAKKISAGGGTGTQMKLDYMFDKMLLSKKLSTSKK